MSICSVYKILVHSHASYPHGNFNTFPFVVDFRSVRKSIKIWLWNDPAVVSTLLNFVRMFERAHEENCKQIEFEKKRAEKNADIEKTNLSAFLKE